MERLLWADTRSSAVSNTQLNKKTRRSERGQAQRRGGQQPCARPREMASSWEGQGTVQLRVTLELGFRVEGMR